MRQIGILVIFLGLLGSLAVSHNIHPVSLPRTLLERELRRGGGSRSSSSRSYSSSSYSSYRSYSSTYIHYYYSGTYGRNMSCDDDYDEAECNQSDYSGVIFLVFCCCICIVICLITRHRSKQNGLRENSKSEDGANAIGQEPIVVSNEESEEEEWGPAPHQQNFNQPAPIYQPLPSVSGQTQTMGMMTNMGHQHNQNQPMGFPNQMGNYNYGAPMGMAPVQPMGMAPVQPMGMVPVPPMGMVPVPPMGMTPAPPVGSFMPSNTVSPQPLPMYPMQNQQQQMNYGPPINQT